MTKDPALGAGQKAGHRQIASYSSVQTWAELLGLSRMAKVLEASLDEENRSDKLLTEIAHGISLQTSASVDK